MGNLLRMVENSRKKHILLAAVFVFVSVFGALFSFSPDTANAAAPTEAQKRECYTKFNDKDIIVSRLSGADQTLFNSVCYGSTYCIYVGDGSEVGSKRVSCTNPNAPSEDASTRANNAETAPLISLACGRPTTPAAVRVYEECAGQVKEIYADCSMSGGPATSEVKLTSAQTATCATPRINALSMVGTKTVTQVTTAIQQGRGESTRILDADTNATTEKECKEREPKDSWVWADGKCTEAVADADIEPVCRGGALGWILCPLSEIAVEITDIFGNLIEGILTFKPLLSREANSQGALIYQVWSIVVGVANVLLVIAFLIVVFSQATSIGLSNYGVKKMLPKIIAAAILMNLSFFLCAIAVDISNILGQGVRGVVQAAISSLPPVPEIKELGGDGKLQQGATYGQYIGFFATGTLALGIAAATGALWAVIPLLVTSAVFFLVIFIMLALRNVLITLLIIASPLAFVAMILPGTNGLFEKWKKLFIALLAVFPIIMGLLYVGILLSHIILLTMDPNAEPSQKVIISALALTTAFVGTVGTKSILEAATGRAGNIIAGSMNNPNKGLIDRAKNRANQGKANSRWAGAMDHRKAMRGYNATLRRGRTPGRINRIIGGKTYEDSARRKAAALEKNEDLDAIKEADAQQSHLGNAGEKDKRLNRLDIATGRAKTYLDKDGNEKKVTRYAQIAAAQKLLESGNFGERSAIYDSITSESDQLLRETVSQLYFKKGDTAAMTPKYGGQLLSGTSGGTEGRLKSVAERIQNGQITPSAMVHDAQATEDILTVASGKKYQYDENGAIKRDANKNALYEEGVTVDYGLSQEKIDGLARVAEASLTNEETAQKAIAPTYYDKISAVATLSPGGGVGGGGTGGGAGGGGTGGTGTP